MASLLKMTKRHDQKKMADMKTVSRRIKTSVSGYDACFKGGIDTRQVGPLIYIAALNERLQSRRTWFGMTG
ncbi:hypothetical protein X737_22770 [Mesorhizobium sp. L48C026A00]|nr:hypothetical protein X737_22770 [Mesorhizobium sp. L48C026A00]